MIYQIRQFKQGFIEGSEYFGETISIIINSFLLSIVYLIGVGFTSLISKIFGKHFLDLKKDASKKTYWQDLDLAKKTKEDYYRQF